MLFKACRIGSLLLVMVLSFGTGVLSESQPTSPTAQRNPLTELSPKERKIITERSKYIYRLDNDVIVDAYYLFHFQDELSRNIVEQRVTRSRGNFSSPETVVSGKKYRIDEEMQSYFSIPLFPATFWFNGKMLNDPTTWTSPELDPIRISLGVIDTNAKNFREMFALEAAKQLPLFVAVDPLAAKTEGLAVYRTSASHHGRQILLEYGVIASFTGSLESLRGAFAVESAKRNPNSWLSFHIVPGKNVLEGVPSPSLDQYMLLPAVDQPATTPVLTSIPGGGKSPIFYEVVALQRYKLNAREVAELYLDGKIQIPYRENARKGGVWACEEHLLAKP